MNYPDWYVQDFGHYLAGAPRGENVQVYNVLDEREMMTQVDLWNFYQDIWAYRIIVDLNPPWVMDVGSNPMLLGILASARPVTTVDVRPLNVELPSLTCLTGTIVDLPFDDETVPFGMSLSVIEHIGLGRYGDPIDPYGSVRACVELERVLQPGAHLLISVPVGDEAVTLFNQHRVFRRENICAWMPKCKLESEFLIKGPMSVWCAEFVRQ